ncbi:MAG TPA: hypothetical protein DDY70_00675 [Clostridiales bacterium]|nr:hypothetical protein [Clostridiales bacterium]
MPRKQMFEGGTKNRILQIGRQLFFENGFDGTGVRAIMKAVGADVGAFYYYYTSKDELFDDVMENFFAPFHADFDRLAKEAEEAPYRSLLLFFIYLNDRTREFRAQYANNMHRTVRLAIRESTLTIMEPYVEKIIHALIEKGAHPILNEKAAAVFVSHGIGGVILHEDSDWITSIADDLHQSINLVLGLDADLSKKIYEEEMSKVGDKKEYFRRTEAKK